MLPVPEIIWIVLSEIIAVFSCIGIGVHIANSEDSIFSGIITCIICLALTQFICLLPIIFS